MDEWKLHGNRTCVFFVAEYVAKIVMQRFSHSCIVPVPPHRGKMLKKGWDQMRDLSIVLAFLYKLPVSFCLFRRKSAVQKTLSRKERLKNVAASISVSASVPDSAVIIDDVMTTGATFETCAAVLKSAGSQQVSGCILFYD